MTLSVFQDRSESKSETCVAYFLVEFSTDYEVVLYGVLPIWAKRNSCVILILLSFDKEKYRCCAENVQ